MGLGLLASLVLAAPLGRLGDPLVLVLVLPPLAVSLEAFGWGSIAADQIRRVPGPMARVLGAYAMWLATSALLTLDVAAVAAASVGLAVGGRRASERDAQLGAAIIGSNVGSLLFPFSNLTNLVVLSGGGIPFAAYVGTALGPQLAAAAGAGVILLWRGRRRLADQDSFDSLAPSPGPPRVREPLGGPARLAALILVAGSAGAIVTGFLGGDVALMFALTAAPVAALAIAARRVGARSLGSSIPRLGVAVILGAALMGGPVAVLAAKLPSPDLAVSPLGLGAVALVGGVLAAALNNLPAAAFGAVWLGGAAPPIVVAYLVGTNILALVTPHGSLATMLCRSVASRAGHGVPHGPYLRSAWRFALAGSLASLAALIVLR